MIKIGLLAIIMLLLNKLGLILSNFNFKAKSHICLLLKTVYFLLCLNLEADMLLKSEVK